MFAIKAVSFRDSTAPSAFAQSLRETGFAVLKDHPIAPERIDEAYALWAAFFADPAKAEYRTEGPDGYYPFRSENAKGVTQKDLKEFFQVYPGSRLPGPAAGATRALYADLLQLGITMLSWLQDNTSQEVRGRFTEPLTGMLEGSDESMLRVLHYPAQDGIEIEEGATRAAAHEDINLITLLLAGSAPGLQARDRGGRWHEVPCDRGMIAVNVGDMLQLASQEHYPSTTHRVVNPDTDAGARLSMPMFIHPRPQVRLSQEVTAGDYLKQRLREIGIG